MIIYNKNLQNLIGVDIEAYKRISEKYKIGKKDGKGKEYDLKTNKLIFEGKYLYGKKSGKGKEYDINGELICRGEYIIGKR